MCLSSRIYCVRSFCFFRVLRGLSATGKTAVAFCIHSKKKSRHKNGSEACLRSRMTAERYWQRMQARKVKRLRCINLCIYYVWSGFSGTPSSAFAYWVWSPRVQRLISESLKRNSFICLSSFVCFFFPFFPFVDEKRRGRCFACDGRDANRHCKPCQTT